MLHLLTGCILLLFLVAFGCFMWQCGRVGNDASDYPTETPMKTEWTVSDTTEAKVLGLIEFPDETGEFHNFEIVETEDRLVFGGATNIGFIESGYIEKDGFSTDETLQELLSDLETYYNDGPKYTSRIVCNERM
jgi:hypothetical protein